MDDLKTSIKAAIAGKDITRLPATSLYHVMQPKCSIQAFRAAFYEVVQESKAPATKPEVSATSATPAAAPVEAEPSPKPAT